MSDADVKLNLIKCLNRAISSGIKPLTILITIALALFPIQLVAKVSEPQGLTYSPEVLQLNTAGTTQPNAVVEMTATTTPKEATPTMEQLILEEFKDAPIMLAVARCESHLDPLADRGQLNVDVGLFQINQVHLSELRKLGLDRRSASDNIKFARILYNQSGLSPWANSKYCWSK